MQINKLPGSCILTADIGGSHITSAIYDTENNSIVAKSISRVEFSSKGSAEKILSSWVEALAGTMGKAGTTIAGVGIAIPGPFDHEMGVSYIQGLGKYEAIYGMNIKRFLAEALGIPAENFRFRNDAEATIAGEVAAGAGRGADNVIGITLGTGFGSARSCNGITRDLNLGSELFQDSIADDHLSTRWFVKRYHELTGITIDGVKDLASMAINDQIAKNVFNEFADNMGDFLWRPIQHFRPEVLIVCGNIAKASHLFLPAVASRSNTTTFKIGELGEFAALIGAADLFVSNVVKQQLSL